MVHFRWCYLHMVHIIPCLNPWRWTCVNSILHKFWFATFWIIHCSTIDLYWCIWKSIGFNCSCSICRESVLRFLIIIIILISIHDWKYRNGSLKPRQWMVLYEGYWIPNTSKYNDDWLHSNRLGNAISIAILIFDVLGHISFHSYVTFN